MSTTVSFRKTVRMGFAALALAGTFGAASMLTAHETQAAEKGAVDHELGKQLFTDWSCGSCHALKAAGGAGHVGPAFDGGNMTAEYAVGRITNGQGAMPAFGGIMTDEEIATLAAYIVEVAEKPE